MRKTLVLATALLVFSSLTLIAQQPDPAPQPTPATPAASTQSNPAGNPDSGQTAGSAQAASPDAANSAAAPVEMRPVNGELVSKLDSKSAKAGDQVVVKTSEEVKTADGTVIPKGSKLVGHVAKVQSHSQGSENSAVGIQFDHAELKGGQSVAIESVIKSVAPAQGDVAPSAPDSMASPTGAGAPAGGGMASNRGSGTTSNAGSSANTVGPSPTTPGADSSSSSGSANAGTVVGKLGNDAIRTTAIRGVFLASMAPAEASTMSGMLFAAKSEVHLEGGTQVSMEVATAGTR
jgi:hypothetical protein